MDQNDNRQRAQQDETRAYLDDLAEEAQSAASMGHLSKVYKDINKLSCKPAHQLAHIKDKAGKVLTSMEKQLRRWREHFEEVFNQPSEPIDDAENAPLRIRMEPPSKAKIVQALKEVKNNKAAGVDGIPTEILKADWNVTTDVLMLLSNDIWTFETILDD